MSERLLINVSAGERRVAVMGRGTVSRGGAGAVIALQARSACCRRQFGVVPARPGNDSVAC